MIGLILSAVVAQAALEKISPLPYPDILCQSENRPALPGGGVLWFNILMRGWGTVDAAHLFVRTDQFDATWEMSKHPLSTAPMSMFSHNVELPSNARAPFRVTILLDGQEARSTTLSGTDEAVTVRPDGSSRTFTTVRLTEKDVPNLYGKSILSLKVLDINGSLVSAETVKLPDWRFLVREAPKAKADAERHMRRKACGPSFVI